MSERLRKFQTESRGFETSRDLVIRRPSVQRIKALESAPWKCNIIDCRHPDVVFICLTTFTALRHHVKRVRCTWKEDNLFYYETYIFKFDGDSFSVFYTGMQTCPQTLAYGLGFVAFNIVSPKQNG